MRRSIRRVRKTYRTAILPVLTKWADLVRFVMSDMGNRVASRFLGL